MKVRRKCVIMTLILSLIVGCSVSVFADEVATQWKCESKSGVFEKGGSWREGVRTYTNGKKTDRMACNIKRKFSSTYSGELKVSIPSLESYAMMHYKINKTKSVSVKYSTSMKNKKKGTWVIEFRPIYNCRNVVQRKYQKVDKQWRKTKSTKKVMTKDYKTISYRVRRISTKNIS